MIKPLIRKKPYTKGSQPYLINRWLEGDATPRGVRPKYNMPHDGAMMPEGVFSLESRADQLFAYGHRIASRRADGSIRVNFVAPDPSVVFITRKVVRWARLREVRMTLVGPNGTHLQATQMRLASVEKTSRRRRLTEEFSAVWRLTHAARELCAVAENPAIDRQPLIDVLERLKAHVTRGRLLGWSESRCQSVLKELMVAQHAIEMHMEQAA